MKAAGMLVSPFLKVAGGLFKKPKGPPEPPSPLTRDDAREEAAKRAGLAQRRGGAADIVTGVLGAEAGPGGKTSLGY